MVAIRNINDIILGLIDFFKVAQPDLDTKPGTVARDLFIEAPASQLSLIYDELSNVSGLQSLILTQGANLDKLAQNYGLSRNSAVSSSGTALLTFSSLDAPFAINQEDLVMTRSGLSFRVTTPIAINPSSANLYRSIATKFRNDLDYVGISDEYAIQVLVQASSPGSNGNIAKYSLSKSTTNGITGVTNVANFAGGSDLESDPSFRNRILSLFNGSSIGTSLGYKNLATSVKNVFDAIVIEPGDPLMTRDGTEVSIASDGTRTIVSEGNGGKVNVIVLGENLIQSADTFIYQDKSNNNDPASDKNDYVIGQIVGDENKTINRRRVDNLKNASLPSQPIESIASVTGSLSGSNFQLKSVDSLGRIYGNYELVKDEGEYSGSPWGFDKFKWISDRISNFSEDLSKKELNTQDTTSYTDVISSSLAQQNILIFNENSKVTSDRSIIQLLHYPAINVTRVYNVNTNERYLISSQNLDSTGSVNKTGRIKISGNTLPLSTDVLQVDYTWVFDYDCYSDYDGKNLNDNVREVSDSIDWGYSSKVKDEKVLFNLNSTSGLYVGNVTHPISSVAYCNKFIQAEGVAYTIQSGVNFGRKAVTLNYLQQKVSSIESFYLKNTHKEVYNTAEADGLFTTSISSVYGGLYQASIILPSDTIAQDGDVCVASLNSQNVYTENCSFLSNRITIPASNIELTDSDKVYLNVSYISNISSLTNSSVSSLPLSKFGNTLVSSNIGNNVTNNFNLLKSEDLLVKYNTYSQYYIELNADINNYLITNDDVVLVIRKSDNAVLKGTISTGTLNYQIIFDSSVALSVNDQVTAFYYLNSLNKVQPFTYKNSRLLSQINQISIDVDDNYYVPTISFVENVSPVSFKVIDPTYQKVIGSNVDGHISSFDGYAKLSFNNDPAQYSGRSDITFYKIEVYDANNFNNNGIFDIESYDEVNKVFKISYSLKHLSKNQVSVIKVSKNKEIWNKNCSIDYQNNRLIINNSEIALGDNVFINYFDYSNLRSAPTNLSSLVSDQNVSSGSILVEGTSIIKLENVVFTCTSDTTAEDIRIDLTEAVLRSKKFQSIPSTLKLIRVVKLEKVVTYGNSEEVVSTIVNYNLKNSKINDNSYYINQFIEDASLGRFEISLPSTTINSLSSSSINNLPKMGDRLRVTLYLANSSDSESLNYTSPGTLYSNKKFASIDKVSSSGFNSSLSSTININTMNQPTVGSRYKIYYDYLAPKKNERITINYNYNQIISEVTFNIEKNRPINADVIVKQAKKILVNVTMNVVVGSSLINSSNIVAQNVKDAIISNINLNSLGATIDSSDLVNAAYSVNGVDRARIIYFNKNESIGQALSLIAQSDEYFSANNITVNIETR